MSKGQDRSKAADPLRGITPICSRGTIEGSFWGTAPDECSEQFRALSEKESSQKDDPLTENASSREATT